jgi:predicted transcriptional regulator
MKILNDMTKKTLPRPTDAELAILGALWERGPSTVREVQESLNRVKETGYTTVLKFMQIMFEKGLVVRDESARSHIYAAALRAEETQRQLVVNLADRAFGGSAQKLVLQALSAKKASSEELAEIRQLIQELEQKTDTKQTMKDGNKIPR